MKPLILAALLALSFSSRSFGQYADQGGGAWRRHIWWFNWAGFTVQEGASRTFTTNAGLTVQITFSNVSTQVPSPWIMNTWPGSILWMLYNFSDPTIEPALYQQYSPVNYNYNLTITATRYGLPVPISIVTADAEASNSGETTTLTTNGSNWQTIEFYRNSANTDDPLTGCGTTTAAIANTYNGSDVTPTPYGQNPVIMTQSPGTAPLVISTYFDHAGTTGGMALAFGVFDPVDRGDLFVTSYGNAQHQLLYTPSNPCNYNPPYPTMNQVTNLYIGQVPGDPDPIQYNNDDSIGVDEEGVSSFATYDGSGSYNVNLTLANTTGANAYLTGWFDYNRDGTYESNEAVTATIPNNATAATLTWTGLPQYLPQGSLTGYGFRFRISSNLAATQNATGYAPDGEVEDYYVTSLCVPLSTTTLPAQSICFGQSADLQTSGGTTYSWTPPTGLSNPSIANPVASPATTTDYTVIASDPEGCAAQSSVTVTVNPSPDIAITGPTLVCAGIADTLTVTGGATAYSWSTANQQIIATGPTLNITPADSTEYYVTATGSNGCTTTDSVGVAVQSPPTLQAAAASPFVCMDDTVTLTASGGDQYAWTSGSGQFLGNTASIIVNPTGNSDYQVQITNSLCHLAQSFTIPITVEAPPTIQTASSNEINCSVGQATLSVTGGVSYQWTPAPGLSALSSANPVVTPQVTTTYYVKGTGANGCSTTDSITQKVAFSSDLSHYPVANAFTPNNDGNNDCFGLKNWPQVNALEFSIFNRWGRRVFYSTNPGACWDGTVNGTPQPAGAYVYQISATTPCGTAFRKGTVILVR